jgi:hypothetical protein
MLYPIVTQPNLIRRMMRRRQCESRHGPLLIEAKTPDVGKCDSERWVEVQERRGSYIASDSSTTKLD